MTLYRQLHIAITQMLKLTVPGALLLTLLLTVPVTGQEIEEQGLLYFPPKLKVQVSITSNIHPNPDRRQDAKAEGLQIKRRAIPETEDILPMVFFDGAGSIAIPNRYQTFFGSSQTDSYADTNDAVELEDLRENLVKYYEVLNILGYRMKDRYPESRIELEGGYSTLPGEDEEVGTARAEVVRDYLTSIWKIGKERITLAPPRQLCDSADNLLRQEEAQRITITASDNRLFGYVSFDKIRSRDIILYFDFTIDPSMAPEEVAGLEIIITADDKLLSRTEVTGSPDSSLYRLQGIWPGFWLNSESPDALTVRANIRTTAGKIRNTDPVRIPISYSTTERRRDYQPEHFNQNGFFIPFFEYRDSTLGPVQKGTLNAFVRFLEEIRPVMIENGSTAYISIKGGTDDLERLEIPDAVIHMQSSMSNFSQLVASKLMTSRYQRPVLFFDPAEPLPREEIIEAWLGQDAVDVMNDMERLGNTPEVYTSYRFREPWLDTLAIARANSIHTYLQENQEQLGPVELRIPTGDEDPPYPTAASSPEARFYKRGCRIFFTFRDLQTEAMEEEEEDFVPISPD